MEGMVVIQKCIFASRTEIGNNIAVIFGVEMDIFFLLKDNVCMGKQFLCENGKLYRASEFMDKNLIVRSFS